MKRTFSLLLALIFLLALTPAVSADELYQPMDSFYETHREDCQYHDRYYDVDIPDRAANLYYSPESAVVVRQVAYGENLWISYTYEDETGTVWGYSDEYDEYRTGWIPMDSLVLRYDSISFREEFADRIVEESGIVEVSGEDIHFWDFPGDYGCTVFAVEQVDRPAYDAVFVDDAGRKWAHVPRCGGTKDVWVFLADPKADHETIHADHAPQRVTEPVRKNDFPTPYNVPVDISLGDLLAVCLGVIALSAVIIFLTRRKQK